MEQAGADLRQETGKGMTAAGVAVSAGRSEVAQYLAAKAAKAAREAKAQADAAALSVPLLNFKLEWTTCGREGVAVGGGQSSSWSGPREGGREWPWEGRSQVAGVAHVSV